MQQFLAESRPNDVSKTDGKNPMIVFSDGEQMKQNMGAFEWLQNKWSGQNYKVLFLIFCQIELCIDCYRVLSPEYRTEKIFQISQSVSSQ